MRFKGWPDVLRKLGQLSIATDGPSVEFLGHMTRAALSVWRFKLGKWRTIQVAA